MADMWIDSESDRRTEGNPQGEKATYQEYLTTGEERLYRTPEDSDHDFNAASGNQETVEDAFHTWRREIARADAWFASVPEADLGRELTMTDGDVVSIRDMVVHMIEEYARHCGHADLLRECIDGRTGQ